MCWRSVLPARRTDCRGVWHISYDIISAPDSRLSLCEEVYQLARYSYKTVVAAHVIHCLVQYRLIPVRLDLRSPQIVRNYDSRNASIEPVVHTGTPQFFGMERRWRMYSQYIPRCLRMSVLLLVHRSAHRHIQEYPR